MQSGLLIFLACLAGTVCLNTNTFLPDTSWPSTQSSIEPKNTYVRASATRSAPTSAAYEDVTEWQQVPHAVPIAQEEVLWGGASPTQENICIGERLMPELFVIGAMQAGTTSLAVALRQSPAIFMPHSKSKDGFSWKEARIFDRYFYTMPQTTGISFPPCSPQRRVAVDATPAYSVEYHVPKAMRIFYGKLSTILKFVLIIREPVARLHSHFHHSNQGGWCKTTLDLSFPDMVENILNGAYATWVMPPAGQLAPGCDDYLEEGCACNQLVEASLYEKQLSTYLNFFLPSQFLVVPFKYISDKTLVRRMERSLVELIWTKLGVVGVTERLVFHSNQGVHAALTAELPVERLAAIQSWFNNVTGPEVLARLLSARRVPLFGLAQHDVPTIAKWLAHSW